MQFLVLGMLIPQLLGKLMRLSCHFFKSRLISFIILFWIRWPVFLIPFSLWMTSRNSWCQGLLFLPLISEKVVIETIVTCTFRLPTIRILRRIRVNLTSIRLFSSKMLILAFIFKPIFKLFAIRGDILFRLFMRFLRFVIPSLINVGSKLARHGGRSYITIREQFLFIQVGCWSMTTFGFVPHRNLV